MEKPQNTLSKESPADNDSPLQNLSMEDVTTLLETPYVPGVAHPLLETISALNQHAPDEARLFVKMVLRKIAHEHISIHPNLKKQLQHLSNHL